jgi:hypothetical protein
LRAWECQQVPVLRPQPIRHIIFIFALRKRLTREPTKRDNVKTAIGIGEH